jgi:hypothetical protein
VSRMRVGILRRQAFVVCCVLALLLGAFGWQPASASTGTIHTIAGNGMSSSNCYASVVGRGRGDGGPAILAGLCGPQGTTPLPGGGYLIADSSVDQVGRIREVSPSGTITTVAGGGRSTKTGRATSVRLAFPENTALLPGGGFLIADAGGDHQAGRVWRVSGAGRITTVAGDGNENHCDKGYGDGGPATSAGLCAPTGVAVLPHGGFLIADSADGRIRKVDAAGTITTVAGNSTYPDSGDGGPATAAGVYDPTSVAGLPHGAFLIADRAGDSIREVSKTGVITTVAGNGTQGHSGDGGRATHARLYGPSTVAVVPGGGFLIADQLNNKIREVSAKGIIRTVAGTGSSGPGGDGGPATSAKFSAPWGISVLPHHEGYLVSDSGDGQIRWVQGTHRPTRPNTKITSAKISSKKHKAAFRFRGSDRTGFPLSFQCKLDRGHWGACKSPRTYRHLKRGRHVFEVRAKDQSGATDATPAKKHWRVR